MEWVVYGIITIISAWLTYNAARNAQKSNITAGTVDIPTAEAGRPIMVLAGTRVIKSPNTGWYGDVRTEAIQR